MKYTKLCSAILVAISLAGEMLTTNSNKVKAATFGLTYGPRTKVQGLRKDGTVSWARVNWKVVTDQNEYEAFHVIDCDQLGKKENGNLFKLNHRHGMLTLPQGYEYEKIPETVKMSEKAGKVANYQGIIKRTSKTTPNPKVKSQLRVHYIMDTKNTSGNVILSEGNKDIAENKKKGIYNEVLEKTFTGTQGETRKLDLTQGLDSDMLFAPDDDQELFLVMPNGKYTFGDCDVDIYVGIADPPQQHKVKNDDFYMTIHYMKDGKEVDQENLYDQLLIADANDDYDRTNPVYLKHMPNTLNMDKVNTVISGYNEINAVNQNNNENKYIKSNDASGLQNALDILKPDDPKLKEYQEKGLTSLIGNVFFAPDGERHKDIYVDISDHAQKVTPIKAKKDDNQLSVVDANANIGSKADNQKNVLQSNSNLQSASEQKQADNTKSEIQKQTNDNKPAKQDLTAKKQTKNNSGNAKHDVSNAQISESAPITVKKRKNKGRQNPAQYVKKAKPIQVAPSFKTKSEKSRPAEKVTITHDSAKEPVPIKKEQAGLLPQTGAKAGGFLVGFILMITSLILPFFDKEDDD